MIESVVQVRVADPAALGWDIYSYNNTRFLFAESIRMVLEKRADTEVVVEDEHICYAAWFTGM